VLNCIDWKVDPLNTVSDRNANAVNAISGSNTNAMNAISGSNANFNDQIDVCSNGSDSNYD
jgi:hypothetical protein